MKAHLRHCFKESDRFRPTARTESKKKQTHKQPRDARRTWAPRPGWDARRTGAPALPPVRTLFLERALLATGHARPGVELKVTPTEKNRLLYAVNHSARESMKDAASCVN